MNIKKTIMNVGLALALCLPVFKASANGLLSPTTVLDTTQGGTNTSQTFINTNQSWPNNFPAGQSVTNVTKIDVSGSRSIVIEMDNQLTVAAAASVTNIVYHLGRSVKGGSPTNGLATANGLRIDWFQNITNQLPASAAANTTYTKLIAIGPVTGYVDGPFEDASTTLYVGWVDPPANLAVTNSQLIVNLSQ